MAANASMTPYDFDQSDDGWRKVDRAGDYVAAAALIDQYIIAHLDAIRNQSEVSIQTMYFHAGQEYAMAGVAYYTQAAERMGKAYKHQPAWDAYVDGSIAFLRGDNKALVRSALQLAQLAEIDPKQAPNAALLQAFIDGSANKLSYANIYGIN